MVRVLATKVTGYPVDANEYGAHWNFFLTLGSLQALSALVNIPPHSVLPAGEVARPHRMPQFPQCLAVCMQATVVAQIFSCHTTAFRTSACVLLNAATHMTTRACNTHFCVNQTSVLQQTMLSRLTDRVTEQRRASHSLSDMLACAGCALAMVHQAVLSSGLINIIHSPERGSSLLSSNKEGLLSLPGYWAIALMSTGLARFVHHSAAAAYADASQSRSTYKRCLPRSPWSVL